MIRITVMASSNLKIVIGFVVLCHVLWHQHEAAGTSLFQDMGLEKQLKILNKSPIKTFQTENGDKIDCIDIYRQPSLDHPLLKNHKIQMKPSSWSKERIGKTSSEAQSSSATVRSIMCPKGTVPIRRTREEDLLRSKSFSSSYATNIHLNSNNQFPNQHIAALKPSNNQNLKYYGANAMINLYNVQVNADQRTSGQMWIENGSGDQYTSLQAGWMIAPNVTGDSRTRLFVYWTTDNSKTGCFNNLCPGFVQVDKQITLGMEIYPLSKYGEDPQRDIRISLYQDKGTGNWWLTYVLPQDRPVHVGYFPKSIFPQLAGGASLVAWGGLAAGPANGDSPPMGNGHFPDQDTRKGCYIGQLRMLDASNKFVVPDQHQVESLVTTPNCYGLQYYGFRDKTIEQALSFGGSGGKC